MQTVAESQFAAALEAAEDPQASPEERAEMLMEIAMSLQLKPKTPRQLRDAVTLYGRALEQQPSALLAARIRSRLGTALQSIPDGGGDTLKQACQCYESAMPELVANGKPEEGAEAQMNLGLALQGLAGLGMARIQDAAIRMLSPRTAHSSSARRTLQEFAILHNNLAIAYLAIPAADERARMREALRCAGCSRRRSKVISPIDSPERARHDPEQPAVMHRNRRRAGTPLENNLRALAAYDEALKVRNPRDTPVEYANTIANMANVPAKSSAWRSECSDETEPRSGRLQLHAGGPGALPATWTR